MAKKESYNKKGMTLSEIEEHLKGLKTNKGQAQYLNKILEKEKLLAPKTKKRIYNKLLDGYMKKEWFDDAEKLAWKIGNKKVLPKILKCYIKRDGLLDYEDSKALAEKIGKKGQEIFLEEWTKKGMLYDDLEVLAEKLGNEDALSKIHNGWKKLLDSSVKKRKFHKAEEFAEKLRNTKVLPEILEGYMKEKDWECAERIAMAIGDKKAFQKIVEGYMRRELRGDTLKAEKLARLTGNKKVLQDILKKHMEIEHWNDAEKLAKELGNKKALPKILDGYMKKEWFDDAKRIAEKLGIKDERLAKIYEHTGELIKAKDIRRRLER